MSQNEFIEISGRDGERYLINKKYISTVFVSSQDETTVLAVEERVGPVHYHTKMPFEDVKNLIYGTKAQATDQEGY